MATCRHRTIYSRSYTRDSSIARGSRVGKILHVRQLLAKQRADKLAALSFAFADDGEPQAHVSKQFPARRGRCSMKA